MKVDIHPTWHDDAKVTCACGNTFVTGSTKPEITVDICSACHPFFTGEMRYVDVQGRVEKFQKKQRLASEYLKKRVEKKLKAKKQYRPETLKEMLMSEKKRLQQEQVVSKR
ncbi:50S ribosomal protein L31 [Microgenomates group bacterium RIFCSPLOWO2_01_FULL_46_13]|nr:MAG: 50S ribosomal protein L31 [Microgenomates group bacterium RIFCSPHIGHO2_01_FULL_45_11]OGV94840.1 MAG: 50S ribosomal protein L31 [Microgenomates group bacterium RIFCSPLOWO2_01_FULL_46_13]